MEAPWKMLSSTQGGWFTTVQTRVQGDGQHFLQLLNGLCGSASSPIWPWHKCNQATTMAHHMVLVRVCFAGNRRHQGQRTMKFLWKTCTQKNRRTFCFWCSCEAPLRVLSGQRARGSSTTWLDSYLSPVALSSWHHLLLFKMHETLMNTYCHCPCVVQRHDIVRHWASGVEKLCVTFFFLTIWSCGLQLLVVAEPDAKSCLVLQRKLCKRQ